LYPATDSGMVVLAMSASIVPPVPFCTAALSTAYEIAWRTLTSSSGFLVVFRPMYVVQTPGQSTRRSLYFGSCRRARVAGCRLPPMALTSVPWPASRRSSMVAGSRPSWKFQPSGLAVRTSSVAGSQFSLRTSLMTLPGVYSSSVYGPDATMSLRNSSPAPEPTGNGAKFGCDATAGKSGNGALRWKTIVVSSAVSMVGRSPDLYGPS